MIASLAVERAKALPIKLCDPSAGLTPRLKLTLKVPHARQGGPRENACGCHLEHGAVISTQTEKDNA